MPYLMTSASPDANHAGEAFSDSRDPPPLKQAGKRANHVFTEGMVDRSFAANGESTCDSNVVGT